jgi:hypothetical protein
MDRICRIAAVAASFFLLAGLPLWPQSGGGTGVPAADIEALKKTAPKIYLDCSGCDVEYIKTEITFVNYVRDRKEAQAHLLITSSQTGSGGLEYTIAFLGQNEFLGLDDTVHYYTNSTFTDDDIRQGLVKTLKLGLMTYVVRTPIAGRLVVRHDLERASPAGPDPWRSWVFSVSGDGSFNGEQSYRDAYWNLSLSANKVTPDIKLRLGLSAGFSNSRYDYESEVIRGRRESYDLNGLFVKAVDDHWSVGFALDASSSTYENFRLRLAPAPAVEFNVFPYSQYARRQLRLVFKIPFEMSAYRDETIYFRTRESRLKESLSATLDMKEKWGSITLQLSGSHYFHDLSKYSLNLYGAVQVNVFKGFNAYAAGGGGRIHDQLSIRSGGASLQDVLLRQRQLATSYNYFLMLGASYTFGSIYTNVVNPRFGRTGGSGVSIIMN